MSQEQRLEMGMIIVREFEGRYKNGKLQVYYLPAEDTGGDYEIAGINDKYHPHEAKELRGLIEEDGRHEAAETQAAAYIVSYTNPVVNFFPSESLANANPNIEFLLRDCAFNRGNRGAATILQIAIGMSDIDGVIGPQSKKAFAKWLEKPADLALMIKDAREEYERNTYPWKSNKRDESSSLWKGLASRWEKAHNASQQFIA